MMLMEEKRIKIAMVKTDRFAKGNRVVAKVIGPLAYCSLLIIQNPHAIVEDTHTVPGTKRTLNQNSTRTNIEKNSRGVFLVKREIILTNEYGKGINLLSLISGVRIPR
jgi:hypothetical protein